jgi:hypothetical protein
MKRNGYASSTRWAFASVRFSAEPGIGWRLYMSKIAAELAKSIRSR